MGPVRLAERVEYTAGGLEHISRAVEGGRGAVLTSTQSGNWDPAGLWPARRVGSPAVVADRFAAGIATHPVDWHIL